MNVLLGTLHSMRAGPHIAPFAGPVPPADGVHFSISRPSSNNLRCARNRVGILPSTLYAAGIRAT